MAEPISIYKIITLLVVISSFFLSFWVYLANRRAKINQLFFAMGISVVFWIVLYYLTVTSTSIQSAIFLGKLAYGAVSIFYLPFYLFFIYFLNLEKRFRYLSIIILLGIIFLFTTSIFTNWTVRDAIIEGGKANLVLGGGSIGFYGMGMFLSLLVIISLIKRYLTFSGLERLKIQYFLIGIFIWIVMNFIFNMIFPILRRDVQYSEFGNYSAIFLLGFTAFAIVKQELFGMKVILTQALVGVVGILLLWQAVVAIPDWLEFSWKFVLFLLFLVFGYFLIQSVVREIQRRAEVQKLYEQVDKLSKAKSEFISIASHQLRTPLTVVKGYISMLLEGSYGKITGKAVRPIERVYESNERLIKLVNDLLHVSRIESGTLRIDLQKTSLENMISSIVDELKIKADEKGLYLKLEKPTTPLPEVTIDADKFRQVILNIIDNCIKYTEKGGVTIKSLITNSKLLITIADTGEGMTKDEIEKMFESFSRGKAGAKHWTAGTGLGLYIARKFTELHDGKVWVESEGEGKGSTFFIELPVK